MLDNCLNSIYRETRKITFETFVVDNGSSDGSAGTVKEKYPQVRLIENRDDLGFAAANNQALKLVSGRYVLILGPDTIILENAIDKGVEFMDSRSDISILGPKAFNGNMTRRKTVFPDPFMAQQIILLTKIRYFFPWLKIIKKIQSRGFDFDYSREQQVKGHIEGACMFFRKEILDRIGFFDEKFFIWFEEVDLCLRAKRAGYKIFYSPELKIIHYGGESFKQEMTLLKQRRYNRSLSYYFWKNKPHWQYFVLQIFGPLSLLLAFFVDVIKKHRKIVYVSR